MKTKVLLFVLSALLAISLGFCVKVTKENTDLLNENKGVMAELETTISEKEKLETFIKQERAEREKLTAEIKKLNEQKQELTIKAKSLEKQVLDKSKEPSYTRSYDISYVARVVAHECNAEPYRGQLAVVQTIMERAKSSGMTPEQIVKQRNQYASPWPLEKVPEGCWKACYEGLVNGKKAFEQPIKWFNNPDLGTSPVHQQKKVAGRIGNHVFYY